MSDRIDPARLRQEVERQMQELRRQSRIGFFVGHLVMTIVFTAIIWIVGLTTPIFVENAVNRTDSPLMLLLIMPTMLAFFSLFFHGMSASLNSKAFDRSLRERATMRALGQVVMQDAMGEDESSGQYEKPKRAAMRLSDDGELVPDDSAEQLDRQQNMVKTAKQ